MVDASGQNEIRGIDIDKLAKGFADEEFVFKNRLCAITPTSAREIRWYQKTSGVLTATTTTGITGNAIANVPHGALPQVVEQTWTRNTSFVRKYFVESPLISDEDIKDNDVDILATNMRDLVRAVASEVDKRIYSVLRTDVALTTGATVTWDNATQANVNIVKDLMVAKRKIREASYNPEGAFLLLTPLDHQLMLTNLIFTQGSNIPQFSTEKIKSGVVMNILGLNVIVSNNVTADEAHVVIGERALSWKTFMPITARTVVDVGIGTKIRVWEEGECIMTDTSAAAAITNTNE